MADTAAAAQIDIKPGRFLFIGHLYFAGTVGGMDDAKITTCFGSRSLSHIFNLVNFTLTEKIIEYVILISLRLTVVF